MKKIKNKKASIDDFGSLIVAGLAIIFIIIATLFFTGLIKKQIHDRPSPIISLQDASYTTRVILQWELDSGERVYESLIKHNDDNTLDEFINKVEKVLETQGLIPAYSWAIVIKPSNSNEIIIKDTWEQQKFINTKKTGNGVIRNYYLSFLRVLVPDDKGGNIEILIKQIKDEDRKVYETRAQLIERNKGLGYS